MATSGTKFRSTSLSKRWVRIAAVLALSGQLAAVPAAIAGPVLAEKVPGDAVFYFGWNGADPAYETSKLAGLLRSLPLKKLFDEKIPELMKKEDMDEGKLKEYQDGLAAARKVFQKRVVIYVKKPAEGKSKPDVGILVDAGADVEALMGMFAKLDEPEKGAKAHRIGNLIWAGEGEPPVVGAGASLMEAEKFLKTGASKGDASVLSIYLDTATLLAAAVQEEPKSAPILEGLGILDVKALHASGKFDKGDWLTEMGVLIPGGGKGLMKKMLESVPAGEKEKALGAVPSDAQNVSVLSFDPVGWSDAVIEALKPTMPEANLMRIRVISGLTVMTGVNIKDDLFEALSPVWTTYSLSAERFVVLNHPRKPELAARSVTKLMQAASRFAESQKARGIPAVTVEPVDDAQTADAAVQVLKVEGVPFTLAWGSKDGMLAFAMTPADVVAALKKPADGGMAKSGKLAAMAGRLNVPVGAVNNYSDLSRSFPEFYDMVASGIPELQAKLDETKPDSGVKLAEWLPAKETLVPYMTEAGGASWMDENGWHYRSVSPFPGAGMSQVSAVGVGVTGVGASILVPSLVRARDAANQVRCFSNLRSLGQAVLLHKNEKGKFPASLEELVKEQDIGWEVFVCPSENHATPPEGVRADLAKRAAWVEANSQYVYVGAGLENVGNGRLILMYEKKNAHKAKGRCVLYADGHVESQPEETFAEHLKEFGPGSAAFKAALEKKN